MMAGDEQPAVRPIIRGGNTPEAVFGMSAAAELDDDGDDLRKAAATATDAVARASYERAQHAAEQRSGDREAAADAYEAMVDDLYTAALHERGGTGGGTVSDWIKNHGGAVVALATALGAAAVNLGFFAGDSGLLHILTVGATGIAFVERVLQAFIAGVSK